MYLFHAFILQKKGIVKLPKINIVMFKINICNFNHVSLIYINQGLLKAFQKHQEHQFWPPKNDNQNSMGYQLILR